MIDVCIKGHEILHANEKRYWCHECRKYYKVENKIDSFVAEYPEQYSGLMTPQTYHAIAFE